LGILKQELQEPDGRFKVLLLFLFLGSSRTNDQLMKRKRSRFRNSDFHTLIIYHHGVIGKKVQIPYRLRVDMQIPHTHRPGSSLSDFRDQKFKPKLRVIIDHQPRHPMISRSKTKLFKNRRDIDFFFGTLWTGYEKIYIQSTNSREIFKRPWLQTVEIKTPTSDQDQVIQNTGRLKPLKNL